MFMLPEFWAAAEAYCKFAKVAKSLMDAALWIYYDLASGEFGLGCKSGMLWTILAAFY